MKKIRVSKKAVRLYFAELDIIETDFFNMITKLEEKIQKATNNKDIEFVWVDGNIDGIGTPNNPKKMKFLHRSDYERTGKTV